MRKSSINRNGSWYFLVNLAIADLGKAVVGLPFSVVSSLYGRWVFGEIGKQLILFRINSYSTTNNKIKSKKGCSFYGFIYGLFGLVSLSTLCLMCIERYLILLALVNSFY